MVGFSPRDEKSRLCYERVAHKSLGRRYDMLCVLERTIASEPTNESAGDHFLSKAFVSGTLLAKTEVARRWLRSADAEVRRAGNALLISARAAG
jgi:hypothetical protein